MKTNYKNKKGGLIKIIPGKEIVFFIESYGQISAKDILEESVKALKDNLKKVVKA